MASVTYNLVGSMTAATPSPETTWFGVTKSMQTGYINGDIYQDLLISAAGMNELRGKLYVYYGGTIFDFTQDVTIEPPSQDVGGQGFPHITDGNYSVGDIDNDGFDDIMAAATYNDTYGTDFGIGYIFFGSNSLIPNITTNQANVFFPVNGNLRSFGYTSSIGDFNGDNFNDVTFGTGTNVSLQGCLEVYFGNGTKMIDTSSDLAYCGTNLPASQTPSLVGKFNSDKFDDILISEHRAVGGVTYIFFGGDPMNNIYDIKFTPELSSDSLSRDMSVGDIDGDGLSDLCIGAQYNDTYLSNAGRVYCFFGSGLKDIVSQTTIPVASASISYPGFILNGQAINDNFGRSVFIKDLNNDSFGDIIVGSYNSGGGNGSVQIFFSNGSQNFDTTVDLTIPNQIPAKTFGVGVFSMDFNVDGWNELFLANGLDSNTVYAFEINHGNPEIQVPDEIVFDPQTQALSGTSTNDLFNIKGVQISLDQINWINCSSLDGIFDSKVEQFFCDLSLLGATFDSSTAVYLRSYDENNLFMPAQLFASTDVIPIPETVEELPTTGANLQLTFMISGIFIGITLPFYTIFVSRRKFH